MRLPHCLRLAFGLAVVSALTYPTWAHAAGPFAYLEDSQSYAFSNTVKAFRVPTIGTDGKVRYYDVTVTLGLSSNGQPISATVTSSGSPSLGTGAVVPGTYKTPQGDVCAVTNFTLTSGRIQSFLECSNTSGYRAELSVATGPISAGHPYLTQLTAEEINKLPDAGTYIWGLTTNGSISLQSCSAYSGYPIGAKTNGSQLILAVYSTNKPQDFRCNIPLTRQ